MRGVLIIQEASGSRAEELSKTHPHGLVEETGHCALRSEESPLAAAGLQWEEAQSTWKLSPGQNSAAAELVEWRGSPLGRPILLSDGDCFAVGGAILWFRRFPAPPIFKNKACEEIPLGERTALVFGRTADSAQAGEEVVLLDPEDRKISRRHVSLKAEGKDFLLRDESQTGSFVNGQRFETHKLIVGDRFQAGAYSFEFTGISLRRTQPRIGGKVDAHQVEFEAGGRSIIRQIDLHVDPCSFAGILGGSGQGKSTLLNALCGINPATRGMVLVEGRTISDPEGMRTAGVGFVPQDDIVHSELKVRDAILFSARLRLDPRVPRQALLALVDETINRLGLTEHRDKRIFQLSGGQRKRVSIATELLAKPAVLFLDEPSSGLDPATEFSLMKILRALAAYDCTVICTTHVLGRAYLFDKIIFIHGGRVIFDGPPDQSYDYFQVESLDQVYVKVADGGRTGDALAEDFEKSGLERPYSSPSPPKLDFSPLGDISPPPRKQPGFLRELWVLLVRQWRILAADPLNVLFLIAQPLLIAILIGWVADDYVLRMFLCVVATLWFGCSNGAQQIIKELQIFRRERVCGLGLNSYLFSKYLFLGMITTLQALLLLMVVQTTSHLTRPAKIALPVLMQELREITTPKGQEVAAASQDELEFEVIAENPANAPKDSQTPAPKISKLPRIDVWLAGVLGWFFELRWNLRDGVEMGCLSLLTVLTTTVALKLLALTATALVGIAIGLAISGLVQNSAQAVMWVPLLLIPQILFGGVVLSLPELSQGARALCEIIPSFSCQRLMDVSNVYGQALPLLSNRTKIPLFLTPGEKESIRWEVAGREYTEYYDELSPANTSWQNLAVFPFAVGQHRHDYSQVETSAGSLRKIYSETTESRSDVKYSKGRIFLNTNPVWASVLVLGTWIGLCYVGTLLALSLRQKGK